MCDIEHAYDLIVHFQRYIDLRHRIVLTPDKPWFKIDVWCVDSLARLRRITDQSVIFREDRTLQMQRAPSIRTYYEVSRITVSEKHRSFEAPEYLANLLH